MKTCPYCKLTSDKSILLCPNCNYDFSAARKSASTATMRMPFELSGREKVGEFVLWAIPILIFSCIFVSTYLPKYMPFLSSLRKRMKASLMQYKIKQNLPLLLKIAGIGAFLLLIWPTPYEYIRDTRRVAELWRVNRFTGLKQQATKTGWRSEAEISDEYNQSRKKEQDIKEQEEALLAKRKEYPAITFGWKNEYQIKLSTAYIKGHLAWEAEISPYEGKLKDYSSIQSDTNAVSIILLNEQRFEIMQLRANRASRISDGKGGTSHLLLAGGDGYPPMTISDYKAIKSFTITWSF